MVAAKIILGIAADVNYCFIYLGVHHIPVCPNQIA